MAGGGGRRDAEATVRIGSGNVFAALETLKRKKKKPPSASASTPGRKVKGTKKVAAPGKGEENAPRRPPEVFWAPAALNSKSWADVEDDDDYFATTAPPRPVCEAASAAAEGKAGAEEETESEDDGLDVDMGDDELEEPEHGHEVDVPSEPEVKESASVPVHSKDTEKQLSKKELKKKELAELDAVLAELGISGNATLADITSKSERKSDGQNGVGDNKGLPAPSESKTSKKKKPRKEKPSKDSKEQPNEVDSSKDHGGAAADTKSGEEATAVDVKEKMKKIAASKKKKSSKEVDAAAKHAAMEAAARSAKLAAAKKKEKNHYNQQPVR